MSPVLGGAANLQARFCTQPPAPPLPPVVAAPPCTAPAEPPLDCPPRPPLPPRLDIPAPLVPPFAEPPLLAPPLEKPPLLAPPLDDPPLNEPLEATPLMAPPVGPPLAELPGAVPPVGVPVVPPVLVPVVPPVLVSVPPVVVPPDPTSGLSSVELEQPKVNRSAQRLAVRMTISVDPIALAFNTHEAVTSERPGRHVRYFVQAQPKIPSAPMTVVTAI